MTFIREDFPIFVIVAMMAVALTVPGCDSDPAPSRGGPPGMMGGRPGVMPAVAVVTRTATSEDITESFTALGTARANESIDVTSRVSSVVTSINFDEGQSVNEGDLLVALENAEIRAQVAQAEAALNESRSQFERLRTLSATQAVSESQLEELQAEVSVGRAQLNAARARLANTRIVAPFSGRVGLRNVSLGGLVQPGTVITTLDDTSLVKLEFGVPETYIAQVAPGIVVEAESVVYPDHRFEGTITTIDSRVDPVTRSVRVIAFVDNENSMLKPGMFLTVKLLIHRDDVLMIPEEALTPRDGRQYVFLVQEEKAMEREVRIGARVPGMVEVVNGLEEGDSVITEGAQKVRTGMTVTSLTGG